MTLLTKELRLAASPLSYWFSAASLLTFLPGYPILVGTFFITLGIFYSFQSMRENGDIAYSLLLPVAKADVVKGKFRFVLLIEAVGFVPTAAITLIRMGWLNDAAVYTSNALMNANLTFLGLVLVVFGLFNAVFVGGFFQTAYYFGKPFVRYCIGAFLVITLAETLHHVPGTAALYASGFTPLAAQSIALCVGALLFAGLTAFGIKRSVRAFECLDL